MKHQVKILSIIFSLALFTACPGSSYEKETGIILSHLTLEQRVGQMMMPAIPGTSMNPELEKTISAMKPGGVILFGYNIASRDQLRSFIAGIQSLSLKGGLPMFISVDQEGGRVVRVVDGVTQFPGAMAAGVCGREELTRAWGRILGMELRGLGINMNFAPVLDVNNNPANPVINTRSFGPDPATVAILGAAYIEGLQEAGCMAVCKHFPGHGDTGVDSHLSLPVMTYDLERLKTVEWVPFARAIKSNVAGVMTAHISFPAILGNGDPATLSSFFLTDTLRGTMKYRGLVITDDMEMKGVSSGREPGEAAVRAVRAGADIILLSSWEHGPVMYRAILDAVRRGEIPPERIDQSVRRILEAKLRYGIMSAGEKGITEGIYRVPRDLEGLTARAADLNRTLSERGITWQGDKTLLNPQAGDIRILVTGYATLSASFAAERCGTVYPTLEAALKERYNTQGRIILFYHVHKSEVSRVASVVAACRSRGILPVIVCTGNPFPFYGLKDAAGILASFSATEESQEALGRCMAGRFQPPMMKDFFPALNVSQ